MVLVLLSPLDKKPQTVVFSQFSQLSRISLALHVVCPNTAQATWGLLAWTTLVEDLQIPLPLFDIRRKQRAVGD